MENPGGCPLQKWLEEHGTVTPQQACAMLEPVFNGVEAMHQVGLVHRGICRPTSASWTMAAPGSPATRRWVCARRAAASTSSCTRLFRPGAVFHRRVRGPLHRRIQPRGGVLPDGLRAESRPGGTAPRLRLQPQGPHGDAVGAAYVSETLYLGLRLKPVERIQTVQQLFRALSEREYAEELSRSMEALDHPPPRRRSRKRPRRPSC